MEMAALWVRIACGHSKRIAVRIIRLDCDVTQTDFPGEISRTLSYSRRSLIVMWNVRDNNIQSNTAIMSVHCWVRTYRDNIMWINQLIHQETMKNM